MLLCGRVYQTVIHPSSHEEEVFYYNSPFLVIGTHRGDDLKKNPPDLESGVVQSKHRPADFVTAYLAHSLAGEGDPRVRRQAKPVEREEDICTAVSGLAFVGWLSAHVELCRRAVGLDMCSLCLVLRSLHGFSFRTPRRPMWA